MILLLEMVVQVCLGDEHIRFQLASFFVFRTGEEAGKLLAERIYFDNETVMRQIRGEMDEAAVIDFPLPHAVGLSPAN